MIGIDYLESLVRQEITSGRPWEGSADPAEQAYLATLASAPDIKTIAEIGFNAGISSYTFLAANPNTIVYSFDLAEYGYTQGAKKYIDAQFPGRHELIVGGSLQTVPTFAQQHPNTTFDLVFIDGSHYYEVAAQDLRNMQRYATGETILVIDDLTPWKPWGKGPTKAWLEAIQSGLVQQNELYRDGRKVDAIEPPGDRSWASGRYIFK